MNLDIRPPISFLVDNPLYNESMKRILISLIAILFVAGCGTVTANTGTLPPQKLITPTVSGVTSTAAGVPLKIVSMNSPVWPGDMLKVTIQTAPGYWCEINGLKDRIQADNQGLIYLVYATNGYNPGYYRLDIRVGKDLDKNPPLSSGGVATTTQPYYPPGKTPIITRYPVEAELITSFFVN